MSPRLRPEYQACLRVIAEAREKKGVTQSELARRLGQPQPYIAKCENGARRLDFVELVEIAEALEISPKTLVEKVREARFG